MFDAVEDNGSLCAAKPMASVIRNPHGIAPASAPSGAPSLNPHTNTHTITNTDTRTWRILQDFLKKGFMEDFWDGRAEGLCCVAPCSDDWRFLGRCNWFTWNLPPGGSFPNSTSLGIAGSHQSADIFHFQEWIRFFEILLEILRKRCLGRNSTDSSSSLSAFRFSFLSFFLCFYQVIDLYVFD